MEQGSQLSGVLMNVASGSTIKSLLTLVFSNDSSVLYVSAALTLAYFLLPTFMYFLFGGLVASVPLHCMYNLYLKDELTESIAFYLQLLGLPVLTYVVTSFILGTTSSLLLSLAFSYGQCFYYDNTHLQAVILLKRLGITAREKLGIIATNVKSSSTSINQSKPMP